MTDYALTSAQRTYDAMEPPVDEKQEAYEAWLADTNVAAVVREEATLFLSDPTYRGPLAKMFDRTDCLLCAECWIDRSKVYARDEWLAHDKDGIITRMEGGHQEAKVHMADLHAFMTAAIVGKTYRGVGTMRLRELIVRVAIESIAQAIEGDDERLMMLMEAGL